MGMSDRWFDRSLLNCKTLQVIRENGKKKKNHTRAIKRKNGAAKLS